MTQLSDTKREAILEAGTRMFLAHGYSAISMDAIAEAAPVSKPTLYNYFTGKPALFGAVISRLCDRMVRALDALKTITADPAAGLSVIAHACVELVYAPDSLRLFRVVIAEQTHFPELGEMTYRAGADPIIAQIAAYLSGIDPASGLCFTDVNESALLLVSMLMGDDYLRCLAGFNPSPDTAEKNRLVERVLRHYLRAHHA